MEIRVCLTISAMQSRMAPSFVNLLHLDKIGSHLARRGFPELRGLSFVVGRLGMGSLGECVWDVVELSVIGM